MKEKFYEYCLDDYSTPGFVSLTKDYYGTLTDFSALIENGEKFDSGVVNAYNELCLGNEKVNYMVAYSSSRFAKRVVIIDKRTIQNLNGKFKYINPYGFDYDIKYDANDIELLLCRKGKTYIICYRATLVNPQFLSATDKWEMLGDMLWGYPGMIYVEYKNDTNILKNLLYMKLKEFTDNKEASEYYNSIKEPDLTLFFEDIFGDG